MPGWLSFSEWDSKCVAFSFTYPLDGNFGIPGPFGNGNLLPTCKYLAMQSQLCGGGLEAL